MGIAFFKGKHCPKTQLPLSTVIELGRTVFTRLPTVSQLSSWLLSLHFAQEMDATAPAMVPKCSKYRIESFVVDCALFSAQRCASLVPHQGPTPTRSRFPTMVDAEARPTRRADGAPPRVGVVYDEVMTKHKNEYYPHPEQPARISEIRATLEADGLLSRSF